MNDQASRLREAMGGTALADPPARRAAAPVTTPRLARAIAVTSGKGGVGKSNLAVNLAVTLSGFGLRVCLLDADLGLANADVLCNLTPRLTLDHVVRGRCRLADVALAAPGGFRLIPGASGVTRIADLAPVQRTELLRQLAALERVADSRPSLILLDLMMPVMDGFEFVLEVRKVPEWRRIPIVVVTAKDVTEEDRRRLNGDVAGLVQKAGLDRDALLAQVREQVAVAGRGASRGQARPSGAGV